MQKAQWSCRVCRPVALMPGWEAFATRVFGVSVWCGTKSVFTSCCSVRYEGHVALPHPPAIVTWTHIKSQPSLKCCELQRCGHHNPNIRRHLAVKGGEQFEVRHYNEQETHQTSSGEHMEDLPRSQHYSSFSECDIYKHHGDLKHIASKVYQDVNELTCLLNTN